MNTYEVKSDIRQTVTIWIAIISLILGNTLFRFSNFLAPLLAKHFSEIADFFAQWEYLGILSSQITVATIFAFISWLFNKYLWQIPCINKLLGVPNLNGIWEGVLKSSFQENGVHKIIDMKLEIAQTWNRMTCTSIFPSSKSFSDLVCLDFESSHGIMLKFTYTNHSEDLSSELTQFAGYNELRLNDANTLSGTYYTKRTPSTRGTILLVRRAPEGDINEPLNAQ